jgi:hypothetical protein
MDFGMAIRASGVECPNSFGRGTTPLLAVYPVPFMALEAQEWLSGIEQIAVDRTMGTVTVEAVLEHIRVREQERPPLIGMTLDTGLLDIIPDQMILPSPAVRIVAINTKNPALLQGMMAGQGKGYLGGLMATETETAGVPRGDLQIRTGMDIMALETGNLVDGMFTGIPVMEIKGGICRMAFKANQGLRRGGQIFQINQRVVVAGSL